jgi:hypothetical protein
MVGGWGYL